MTTRHQTGYIFKKGGFWYVRYYDNVIGSDGLIVRARVCRQLCRVSEEYRSKGKLKPMVEKLLAPINASGNHVAITFGQYWERHYLPWLEQNRRPSTTYGYKYVWSRHVKPRVGDRQMHGVRTVEIQKLLEAVAEEHDLAKSTLKHIQHSASP